MRTLAVVIVAVAGFALAMLLVSASAWERGTQRKIEQLRTSTSVVAVRSSTELADPDLPPPVARYFRGAFPNGRRPIRWAKATQDAEFFANNAWRPLTATQVFSLHRPGFVWDARIEMAPFLPAFVRDAYVDGSGSMQASLMRAYTLVDQSRKPELDSGALQRYLGEAMWFPVALLPENGVKWTAIDDRSALATLTDAHTTVSLRFSFDAHDRIIEVMGNRFAESEGTYTLKPWRVQCGAHAQRGGMIIPIYCEVAWLGANGPEPYWRGRMSSIEYEFEP